MKEKEIKHNVSVAHKCFHETYKSIQLSSLYVLYYDMDFSKQRVKNFNKFLTEEDSKATSYSVEQMSEKLKKIGFDCKKEAAAFPFRAKLKMVGQVKPRDMDVAIHNINDALELYMILAIGTMRKHYSTVSWEKVHEWWQHVKDFSVNYANGMNDEHVMEYFMKECGLEITELSMKIGASTV